MQLDIDFNKEEETALLTFSRDAFETDNDIKLAIAIITTFCGDFALDPELEPEDFEDILEQCREKDAHSFIFEINEDGIEVELIND